MLRRYPPRVHAPVRHARLGAQVLSREMLRRELYIGHLVWNRSRFIKVPGTNKRVSRPRPKTEWRIVERPELKIVSDDLWQAVQARQATLQKLYGGQRPGLLHRSIPSGKPLTGFLKGGLGAANP